MATDRLLCRSLFIPFFSLFLYVVIAFVRSSFMSYSVGRSSFRDVVHCFSLSLFISRLCSYFFRFRPVASSFARLALCRSYAELF